MKMFESALSLTKRLIGKLCGYGVNGRRLQVFQDDVFLVGYPKSGNTWLDFLVACLCVDRPEDVNFEYIEKCVADIYYNDAKALLKLSRPRYLKSHEPFDTRYPKVVYIVRDPRAVAISYYHYLDGLNRIPKELSRAQYINEFIQGRLDNYGTWEKHVSGWLSAYKSNPDCVMVVKYEDLKSATEQTLSNIASFLGIDAPVEKIQAAIKWSGSDNMRRLEIEARNAKPSSLTKFKEGSFFVRKANAHGWKVELEESLAKQIEVAWGDTMRDLGYLYKEGVQK